MYVSNCKDLASIALMYVIHGSEAMDLCMSLNLDAAAHCMIFLQMEINAYEGCGMTMGVN